MEECQRCHEVGEDRRTISMACFYDMDELGLPFKQELMKSELNDQHRKLYTIMVCKQCRGSWMETQANWFHGVDAPEESCGSGIFIREYGDVKEITEEEWNDRIKNNTTNK
jgi:hypothetical protein